MTSIKEYETVLTGLDKQITELNKLNKTITDTIGHRYHLKNTIKHLKKTCKIINKQYQNKYMFIPLE